jgi:hypothetical protein
MRVSPTPAGTSRPRDFYDSFDVAQAACMSMMILSPFSAMRGSSLDTLRNTGARQLTMINQRVAASNNWLFGGHSKPTTATK